MPYSIARGKGCSPSKPWAVVKDTDGSVVACHASKDSALAQIRALYASEPALAKARERVLKHPGHGDQKSHGRQKKMTGKWGATRTGSTVIATASRDIMGLPSRINVASANLTEADYEQAGIALDNISNRPALVTAPLVHNTSRMPELETAKNGDVVKLGLTATATQESGSFNDGYLEDNIAGQQILVFTGTKPTHLYSGRRSAPDEAIVAGEFKVVGTRKVDVERKRLVNGKYETSTSTATVIELEQTATFNPETKSFDAFSSPVTKHLPGQHPQKTHATGGGGTPDGGAPKKRNKKDIAADDQRALELYESGKTWDQVAEEMGFANGGVARRAGKRHEERRKAGDGTDKKPDETPDKVDKPEPPKPTPPPVDVTNPRPMTDKDPSQQLVPTENFQEAVETGRPFKPFTEEGKSQKVRDAEQKVLDADDEYERIYQEHAPAIAAREKKVKEAYDAWSAEVERRRQADPRKPEESITEHHERVRKQMEAEGIKEPTHPVSYRTMTELIKEGVIPESHRERLDAAGKIVQNAYEERRRAIEIDTIENVLGTKVIRQPVMEIDFDAPRDPVTGERPMKQRIDDYGDGKGTPVFRDIVEVEVRGMRYEVPVQDILRGEGDWRVPQSAVIQETSRFRQRVSEQQQYRHQGKRSDPTFEARQAEQLQRQQAIVDSPHTRIVVHAPVSAVGGIVTSGRIKSQHETGRTKGFKGQETRAGFEAATMGIVSGAAPTKEERTKAPIYGALHLGGVRDPKAVGAEQYGEVGFVLRREVHQRATFTEGDSLGLCFEPSPLSGRQTQPNGHVTAGGVDVRRFNNADTPERFAGDIAPAPRRTKGYHEAQVIGGVSLADIEYVTVPKGTKLPEASRKKLAKAGIPIVEYDIADVAPPIIGTEGRYPEKGKPYEVPKFADGDWGNIPEPTTKTLGVIADIFKFRRRHNTRTPLRSLSISTNITPTVTMKHLAGQHDQSSHSGKRNVREGTSELPEVLTTEELKGMRSTVNPDFLDPTKASSRYGDEEFSASELMKLPAENSHNLSLLDSESADYLENARQINSGGMNQRVRTEGVFQPIILRQWDDGTRSIYDGHHRLIAAYDNHPDFRVPVFVWEEQGKLEDEFSSMSKHLAGKHDQSTHGRGGGVSAPRDSSRAKQKQAWDLYQQGKTWEEVAKEVGYANGGAARLAAKAHEKRMKGKDGDDKPELDDPPKPKTDVEGDAEIARAKAIVDEATGGRPVAEVLREERNAVGKTDAPPTAKELEVTEAVIQAGAILRGEVQRRREIVGKQTLDTAKAELETLKAEKSKIRRLRDETDEKRKPIDRAITEGVMKSRQMDENLDDDIERALEFGSNRNLKDQIASDRSGIKSEMLQHARTRRDPNLGSDDSMQYGKDVAKRRFPDDLDAQADYLRLLERSVWSARAAESEIGKGTGELPDLIRQSKELKTISMDYTSASHDLTGKINKVEALINDGGVTPEQNAEIIRSVLQQSGRTMTDKPNQTISGTKPAVAELRSELVKIPDELWNDQRFTRLKVKAVTKGRGHWSSYDQEIKTDGAKGSGRRASTLLHEAMHAVEDMNPQIMQLQFVMLSRRAKGRQPEQLSKIIPLSGYRKNEVAIKDEWSSPYSGKVYRGGGRRENHEIMTMGIESLYKRDRYPHSYDIADDDHLNFVMGVLAHA